ncbi:MAG: NAD(P)/FAD-dependent oxidoreductase [bacterium]
MTIRRALAYYPLAAEKMNEPPFTLEVIRSMYDVIVVGARCAGSPLAMLLARRGHKVLVVDRAKFPSDTLSTHFMTPDGVARLGNWGLLDRVLATGAPPLHGTFRNMQGMAMPADPNDPLTLAPRRTVLDNILVQAAREAGAEVREGARVESVLVEDGVVRGIKGRVGDVPFEEQARVVVGADGRESFVARQVNAPSYNEVAGTTAGYYAYFSGFEAGSMAELYMGGGRAMFVFPTNDGETCLGVEYAVAKFPDIKGDIEGNMREAFSTNESLGSRLGRAARTSKFMGLTPHKSFYRKPFGQGWALVGDAGYYRDPLLGQGINDAFRDADELANALDSVLKGNQEFESAMSAYEKQRNDATAMIYQITALLTKDLDPTPETMALLAAGPPPPVAAG